MMDITVGQYYPGESCVHKMDPRTKILSTLTFIMIVFLANTYLAYFILFGFIIAVTKTANLPLRLVAKSVKPLWLIVVMTFMVHIFTGKGDVLWAWKFLSLTQGGLQMGIMMSLRLIFLIVGSSLLTFTTSPIVLTDGIETLLRPFKCIGVPAHDLAMMMTIALRFIPTLLEETDKIMKAQTARGADFASGNLLKKAKNLIPLLVPLFISAFRRADELATAMEARCYRGGEGRTRMHVMRFSNRDYFAFLAMLVLTVFLVFLKYFNTIRIS